MTLLQARMPGPPCSHICANCPGPRDRKENAAVERVTAYIPAYNVSEYLARTIEGLLAQTHAFDEILVIDDGSHDNSAEIASRYPQVTLIKHPVNKGLSAARNTALRAA